MYIFSVLGEYLNFRGGFVSWQMLSVLVWYSADTSVMWKPEASSLHTMRMDFTVRQETTCVPRLKLGGNKKNLCLNTCVEGLFNSQEALIQTTSIMTTAVLTSLKARCGGYEVFMSTLTPQKWYLTNQKHILYVDHANVSCWQEGAVFSEYRWLSGTVWLLSYSFSVAQVHTWLLCMCHWLYTWWIQVPCSTWGLRSSLLWVNHASDTPIIWCSHRTCIFMSFSLSLWVWFDGFPTEGLLNISMQGSSRKNPSLLYSDNNTRCFV